MKPISPSIAQMFEDHGNPATAAYIRALLVQGHEQINSSLLLSMATHENSMKGKCDDTIQSD